MKHQRYHQHLSLRRLFSGLLIGLFVLNTMPAIADERESLEQLRATTLNLIQMLVQEGILSKEKADTLVKQAEAAKAPAQIAEATAQASPIANEKSVRVQYVPEFVKNQLRDEIQREVMDDLNYKLGDRLGVPTWIDRISFEGDLRLRYEQDRFALGNTLPAILNGYTLRNANNIANSTEDRDRFRVRARLLANMKINDWLTGGIGLTTGSITDPISPNQTLNTKDSKFSFALDRAYLKAQPYSWMNVVGGRFANPFFSTDLVWDPDLAFDGISANFNTKLNSNLGVFSTVGAFPLEEIQSSNTNAASDKWMYGAQAGIDWKVLEDTSAKLAVAYYDYQNVEGTPNTLLNPSLYNGTVLSFRQRGNNTFDILKNGVASCGGSTDNSGCGLASEFKELNLTGQIDIATFNPTHVILTADYVNNLGFDQQKILARTGNTYKKETEGYQLKLMVGTPKVLNKKDWQIFGAYKRLEADAVLDAFTDSDFHLGGTDAKGWIAGASYGLDKNAWVTARWFSADTISGLPLSIDVLMVDLNAKF